MTILDPFMARLAQTRDDIIARGIAAGFQACTCQFTYPEYAPDKNMPARPSLHVELWINRPQSYRSPDHVTFLKCSPEEYDVLRELHAQAVDWIKRQPDPKEKRALQALDRIKALAEEAAAAGLTYQSAVDHMASHYPQPEDEGPVFLEDGPVPTLEPTLHGLAPHTFHAEPDPQPDVLENGEPDASTRYTEEDLRVILPDGTVPRAVIPADILARETTPMVDLPADTSPESVAANEALIAKYRTPKPGDVLPGSPSPTDKLGPVKGYDPEF